LVIHVYHICPAPAYGFPEKPKSSYRLSVNNPRKG
jgi:hypothetical protein